MSTDKQNFALHCDAKNEGARKRLGIKGGFFWTEAKTFCCGFTLHCCNGRCWLR